MAGVEGVEVFVDDKFDADVLLIRNDPSVLSNVGRTGFGGTDLVKEKHKTEFKPVSGLWM